MSSESTYSIKKRTSLGPATVVVKKSPAGTTRMSYGGMGGGNVIGRTSVSRSYSSRPGALSLKPGTASHVSKESVGAVMANRGKEKDEMTDLNNRFASYIEKVRYLEATNKMMTQELEKLRKMKGYTQDRVKLLYEDELKEALDTIKELSKKHTPLESKILSLQDELDTKDLEIEDLKKQRGDLQNKVEQLNQMCGEIEGELAALRKSMDTYQSENDRLRAEVENLRDDNARIRMDSEEAITAQLDASNRAEAAEEELDFIKNATDEEIRELKELLQQQRSSFPKMHDAWAGEFKKAIQQMKTEYEDQLSRVTDETRRSYEDQLLRIKQNINKDETDAAMVQTEVKTLKSQLHDKKNKHGDLENELDRLRGQLRDLQEMYDQECEECIDEKQKLKDRIDDLQEDQAEVMIELEALKDKKLSLELEICTYRKLLEGEEKCLKKVVEGKVQSQGAADLAGIIQGIPGQSQQSTMSESTGMVRVTRSSKCAVSISDTAQDGSYIKLENTSTKDFDLSNFKLERSHPKGKCQFKFQSYKLPKGKSVKIYGNAFEDGMDKGSLLGDKASCKTWGVGNGNVSLIDEKDKDQASSMIVYN